jgi:glutamate-5-semialdehyde dehydrogenase
MTHEKAIEQVCQQAKTASQSLALTDEAKKNEALLAMADCLHKQKENILTINSREIKCQQRSPAFMDRMTLTPARFDAMVDGIKKIVDLPDPVGRILASWSVPSELQITRIAIPLGVIAVIYEARPNVTADAAALCLKAGSAIILRGGSECEKTNRAIVDAIQQGLKMTNLDPRAIQYIPEQDRSALETLLKMDDTIDVIIPRGSKALITSISENSRIPVFRHLEGICHTYIHQSADLDMAKNIVVNAKMRRPGICGATETLLIDKAIAKQFLPSILDALIVKGCVIHGDEITQSLDQRVLPATESDWSTEYLEAILSVKVVDNIASAICHIQKYSSSHTDAIIAEDHDAAMQFIARVDSANVMHNCSTQFADGGEFGMGTEIGISTGKLHARGPVGLEQLTTFKYVVRGTGQIRPL